MAREPQPTVVPTTARPPRVAVLDLEPDLLRHLRAGEAERARRTVTAPLAVAEEGPFEPARLLEAGANAFGALVLSGLVYREVSVGGQPTLRLLGPGDVLHAASLEAGLLVADEAWSCSLTSRFAILDDQFLHAVRRWPRLLTALVQRALEGHDATLIQLAISQQPRVEDRLVALFGALAERWGRMTPDGVIVPLDLTHEALGRLVGARRPTVTLALKALSTAGRLERRRDGAWRLLEIEATVPGAVEPLTGPARPRLVALPPEAEEPWFTELNPFPALRAQARMAQATGRRLCVRSAALVARAERARAHTQALLTTTRLRRDEANGRAPAASR